MEEKDMTIYKKSRRRVMFDNFLGGIAWGVGSLLGATVVVGVLGLVIVFTRNVPFLGSIVDIIKEQVQTGLDEFKPTDNTINEQ